MDKAKLEKLQDDIEYMMVEAAKHQKAALSALEKSNAASARAVDLVLKGDLSGAEKWEQAAAREWDTYLHHNGLEQAASNKAIEYNNQIKAAIAEARGQ
jgi:hypothetical protein